LRPHTFSGRELTDALGALAVETPEHRGLREREAVSSPKAPDHLPKDYPQLRRESLQIEVWCQFDVSFHNLHYRAEYPGLWEKGANKGEI
jgi:hypothetical protein